MFGFYILDFGYFAHGTALGITELLMKFFFFQYFAFGSMSVHVAKPYQACNLKWECVDGGVGGVSGLIITKHHIWGAEASTGLMWAWNHVANLNGGCNSFVTGGWEVV